MRWAPLYDAEDECVWEPIERVGSDRVKAPHSICTYLTICMQRLSRWAVAALGMGGAGCESGADMHLCV